MLLAGCMVGAVMAAMHECFMLCDAACYRIHLIFLLCRKVRLVGQGGEGLWVGEHGIRATELSLSSCRTSHRVRRAGARDQLPLQRTARRGVDPGAGDRGRL